MEMFHRKQRILYITNYYMLFALFQIFITILQIPVTSSVAFPIYNRLSISQPTDIDKLISSKLKKENNILIHQYDKNNLIHILQEETSTNVSTQVNISMISSISLSKRTSATAVLPRPQDQMTYLQTLTAGAISRTVAQTIMHPVNTYKTLLQLKRSNKGLSASSSSIFKTLTVDRLLRGADAQFLMSLPHGAFHFFVIERVKHILMKVMPEKYNIFTDFVSSTISTVVCSIVSTPQMVLTDRLMADVYPSFGAAISTILKTEGFAGFYTGWWPALAQKIPSYALVSIHLIIC